MVTTTEVGALRRVVVAATFTAEPLEESLAFWFERLRLPFEVQFASFNQVFQVSTAQACCPATNAAST